MYIIEQYTKWVAFYWYDIRVLMYRISTCSFYMHRFHLYFLCNPLSGAIMHCSAICFVYININQRLFILKYFTLVFSYTRHACIYIVYVFMGNITLKRIRFHCHAYTHTHTQFTLSSCYHYFRIDFIVPFLPWYKIMLQNEKWFFFSFTIDIIITGYHL